MDRRIEKQIWTGRRVALLGVAFSCVIAVAVLAVANSGKTHLNIDVDRLSVSQVRQGVFQEYVPVNGRVQPNTTVYLDLEEGGIVEKIYVQGGNPIKRGDLILAFSNTAAQKQNIEAETRLLENLDQLRNSKISLTTSNLILKDQLLDLEYKIADLQKTFERYQHLVKGASSALSKEQFENTRDQLTYLQSKRDLLRERIRRETELQVQQSEQVDSSIRRVNRNLGILSKIVDSLEVHAPIDGNLSTLNAEIGQSFQSGQRIGQIDQVDSFKVHAEIDQYYIAKVAIDQKGKCEIDGHIHELKVIKVYPEVSNDVFQADLEFIGAVPDGIKRGQTLQIDLSLSESKTANMVDKGGFYRYTNGRWAYLLSSDGRTAHRTDIVLGRQNPQSVEVLEGLRVGDRIITSNYEDLGDVKELVFSNPLSSK